MDFKLSKEQELIQKPPKDFSEKYIMPIADQNDRENKVPPEVYKKMSELELFGIPFSEEVGGTGAGYSCYPLAVEQIARGDRVNQPVHRHRRAYARVVHILRPAQAHLTGNCAYVIEKRYPFTSKAKVLHPIASWKPSATMSGLSSWVRKPFGKVLIFPEKRFRF